MKTQSINSDPLFFQDATTLAELIRTKEVSPVEVVKAHLDRIEAVNPAVNAVVTVADSALEAAKKAEAAVLRGDDLGPLHGVPFSVKDSIDTEKVLTQRGSPIFKGVEIVFSFSEIHYFSLNKSRIKSRMLSHS